MMTRKDFEAIAHVLDANQASLPIVLDFADMLAEQNPRFDKARFIAASTIERAESIEREKRMRDRAMTR